MKPDRFHASTAGQAVRVEQKDLVYWAFLPNRLPPDLSLGTELVCALSEADRALGELAGLGRLMPNPHLLIGPFLRREAVLSSRIEGTQADIADLYAYEAGEVYISSANTPPPPKYDVKEVRNYVQALEYGLERLQSLPVSLRLIRELHERLMSGVRGEQAKPGQFRDRQNWIGAPGCTPVDADFVPPPVPLMHKALDDFEEYLQGENRHPPLVRLALIHYQFETIHPFLDGNGRIGRLLIALLLVRWDLLTLPLLYLSAYFERHRRTYYDLLQSVSERGSWSDWIVFFLRGVTEQARDAVTRAKGLQDLQGAWRERLQEERAPGWYLGLIDKLFEQPVLSSGDVQEHFDVTHPTAMSALRRFEEMGILREMTGRQRSRVYAAEAVFDLLE
jgi:Fic family protein